MAQVHKNTKRPVWEVVAVIATGITHLIFEEAFHAKGPFIAIAAIGWLSYVIFRARQESGALHDWGLRLSGIRKASVAPLIVLLAGTFAIACVAMARDSLNLHWHILPLFLIYPIWGIIQQFLIQALVVNNLSQIKGGQLHVAVITLICALLFGVVHWPDYLLMGGTFLLGLVFTPIYLRTKSILPLGIVHGWLGAMMYFWILDRDPIQELFGVI